MVVGVYKNGRAYIKGYGAIEKGGSIAPDSATIFELASTSKLFTTATLQLLADKGANVDAGASGNQARDRKRNPDNDHHLRKEP